jgi:hypothetical protein
MNYFGDLPKYFDKGQEASYDKRNDKSKDKMKHKHAELIHAWAEGAKIERRISKLVWIDCDKPSWLENEEYRLKIEPIIREDYLIICDSREWAVYPSKQNDLPRNCLMQLKLTYINHILESSEVLK